MQSSPWWWCAVEARSRFRVWSGYTRMQKMDEGPVTVAVSPKYRRCSYAKGIGSESSGPVRRIYERERRQVTDAVRVVVAQAFRCAGFSMREPQYFRYEWLRESDAAGVVRAEADLDGDGAAEIRLEHEVVCGASGCQSATQTKETEL